MRRESSTKRPIPTVRAIVPNERGKILFLRRAATEFGGGSWCLPGGKVEYGEELEEALRTEIREEIGLECSQVEFLFHQDSLPTEPGAMHCINFYFECQILGKPNLNSESDDWAWIGLSELKEYRIVFRNDEAVKRYWSLHAE